MDATKKMDFKQRGDNCLKSLKSRLAGPVNSLKPLQYNLN